MKNASFNFYTLQAINGVKKEGKGKSGGKEPCFSVKALSFARETKDK